MNSRRSRRILRGRRRGEWEREFIRQWLKLRDERKKEHYAKLFEHRRVIAEALEFDRPQTAEEVMGESM